MARTVWKYRIGPGTSRVQIPWPARVLTVMADEQHEVLWLYALVDPYCSIQHELEVRVLGTGHASRNDLDDFQYVATAAMTTDVGPLRWHVFIQVLSRGHQGLQGRAGVVEEEGSKETCNATST